MANRTPYCALHHGYGISLLENIKPAFKKCSWWNELISNHHLVTKNKKRSIGLTPGFLWGHPTGSWIWGSGWIRRFQTLSASGATRWRHRRAASGGCGRWCRWGGTGWWRHEETCPRTTAGRGTKQLKLNLSYSDKKRLLVDISAKTWKSGLRKSQQGLSMYKFRRGYEDAEKESIGGVQISISKFQKFWQEFKN